MPIMHDKSRCYPHHVYSGESWMSQDTKNNIAKGQLEGTARYFKCQVKKYNNTVGYKSALPVEQKETILPYIKMLVECGWPTDQAEAIIHSRDYDTKSLGRADMAFKSIGDFALKPGVNKTHAMHISMHYIAETLRKTAEAEEAKYSPNQPRVPRGNPDGGEWTDAGGGSGGGATSEGIHEVLRRNPKPLERVGVLASNSRDVPVSGKEPLKVDTAIQSLHDNVSSKIWGNGKCATNVANAIRASGIPLGRPTIRKSEGAREPWAKDYGETLEAVHFSQIAKNDSSGKYPPSDYRPQKGDVVVIQPIPGQKPEGHMAMYDGRQWVSDFRQDRAIWSNRHYEQHGADYKIYRHPNRI